MVITCVNCKQTWKVPVGQTLVARIKYRLGFVEHAFPCPDCHTKNFVAATEFEKSDHPSPQIPVTGPNAYSNTLTHHPARADNDGASAPINPVPGPDPNGRKIHAVVLERGVHLLRDHRWNSETMDKLSKGQDVTILNFWTDGEQQTWVQLGPERWALTEQDGEPLFELTDR